MTKAILYLSLLIIACLSYTYKSTLTFPDEYRITSVAVAPEYTTNYLGDKYNMVLGTENGFVIFANTDDSTKRDIYNTGAYSRIWYVGWNKGGVISAGKKTIKIFDPVTHKQWQLLYPGNSGYRPIKTA